MILKWIRILYFSLPLPWNVYGQNAACNKDVNTLYSCDDSEVSRNNIYIDFGEIKYQCSCSISLNFSGKTFYSLASNPGYADCGTAVEVIDSNYEKVRLQCEKSPNLLVLTNRSSTVELVKVDPVIDGPTAYCLRVFTNDEVYSTIYRHLKSSTQVPQVLELFNSREKDNNVQTMLHLSNIITASCGSFESTSTVVRQNTAIGMEKTTPKEKTQTKPGNAVQTTLKVVSQTQTITDGLDRVISQTIPGVVRMNKENGLHFPKWEILGAGAGVGLLVFFTIIFIIMRSRKSRRVRESLVMQNQILEEKAEKVRNLTENPLYQPADDFEQSKSSKVLDSEEKQAKCQMNCTPSDVVEYGLRENPLYQSADDEINETEEKTRTESNANYSFYSEIDGDMDRTRENVFTYDYAYTHPLVDSTDN